MGTGSVPQQPRVPRCLEALKKVSKMGQGTPGDASKDGADILAE